MLFNEVYLYMYKNTVNAGTHIGRIGEQGKKKFGNWYAV